MKQFLCATLFLSAMPAFAGHGHHATCKGSGTCRACKNCKYCGHCKGGGTCSVCKKAASPKAKAVLIVKR